MTDIRDVYKLWKSLEVLLEKYPLFTSTFFPSPSCLATFPVKMQKKRVLSIIYYQPFFLFCSLVF